jgi:fatty-acid desaturase
MTNDNKTQNPQTDQDSADGKIVNENTGQSFTPEEIQKSRRIWKKVTPTGTLDWYVKWAASIVLLVAVAMRASEFSYMADLVLSTIGISGWLYVALVWKDRALIMVNGVALFMLVTGLLTKLSTLF